MLKLPLLAATTVVFATSFVADADPHKKTEPTANEIADRVQKFYDKTRSFQAKFQQRYELRAYHKIKESAGRVVFEKPGKMSWRYTTNGNRIVYDGKLVKVYEAANKQMYVQPMSKSQYPAALAFLVGGGKLKKQLALRKGKTAVAGGYQLVGVPKTPTPAYKRIILYVDGGTYQVRRVLLLDAQGNRNRFDFDQPSLNQKIATSEFMFQPPTGTQVIR